MFLQKQWIVWWGTVEGRSCYQHTMEKHSVQGGGMLKGTGVSPSQLHTVDFKPPPRGSLRCTGCFDSPPTRTQIAGQSP